MLTFLLAHYLESIGIPIAIVARDIKVDTAMAVTIAIKAIAITITVVNILVNSTVSRALEGCMSLDWLVAS